MKTSERTDLSAEFFTPMSLVKEMIAANKKNATADDYSDPSFSVLDPACGNGQFIVGILNEKVKCYFRKNKIKIEEEETDLQLLQTLKIDALKETYGADLMASNIADLIARIVFWKTWDIEIFDDNGYPKEKLSNIDYDDYDDAYWLKSHIESGGKYKRVYEYGEYRVAVRPRSDKWWIMEYSILGADNNDYTGDGFCSNFVIADGLKYDYEFNREPVLETPQEEYIRLSTEKRIRDGLPDQSTLEF